jgi:hypothetical protein
MTGAYIVALALALAVGFGLYRKSVDGRVRAPRGGTAPALAVGIGQELGGTATFVQFSSNACAPCRVTARVLEDVRSTTAGVAHIEIDAEQRLDLVGELGITRTPTVLLLDGNGTERGRIIGAPRKQDVLAALDDLRNSLHRGRVSRTTDPERTPR